MSGDIVEEPFKSVTEQVEEAHKKAVADLKDKVAKAKEQALKKVSP